MGKITKNRKVSFLDVRKRPSWELLDLKEETDTYEFELFESIMCEFTDIAGFQIEYYLMNADNVDHLYGEDQLKGYDGRYRTKLLYEPTNEQSLMDVFGFSEDTTIQYAEMPKAIFERDIMEQVDERLDIDYDKEERKPRVSDVIKTLWDGKIYEISYVSSGEKIFHGKKLVWSLVLRPYRYNMDSSVEEKEMVFDELELDDFPEVNHSTTPIETKVQLKENNYIEKESDKIDDYGDVDTETYGYFSAGKKKG